MNRATYHDAAAYVVSLERLLSPRSVAIVGASESGRGRVAVENFRRLSFGGQVVCVNPKYDEVVGYPCVPSLADVPFQPDAVLIAVATERVVPTLEAAAERGARGAVVFAFGFADAGEEGRDRQRLLVELATDAEMAVVGPNCQGLINFTASVALYTDQVDPYRAGRVALIAESGSVLTSLVNSNRGVRWSHAISSGNEAVSDAADFAKLFVDSPDVDVVCTYLETVRRPQVFLSVCEKARDTGKVVVVLPVGRSQAAQEAAVAHSGALALPHDLLTAALEESGAIVVISLEQLLETAMVLQTPRKPSGNRIAVMSASGGQNELVLDNMAVSGLELASLCPTTISLLNNFLPPFLPAQNPLDRWGVAEPDSAVPAMASALAADPDVDMVVQVADFSVGPTGARSRAAGGALKFARSAARSSDKMFVLLDGVGGTPSPEEIERDLEDGIVVLSGFAEGLKALGHLAQAMSPLPPRLPRRDEFGDLASRWRSGGRDLLGGSSALGLMQAAGFDVVRHIVVSTPTEAITAASEIGFPVVLKLADDGISHKTELGGVILNISSETRVKTAAADLLARGNTLMVQEQVGNGHEMILGVKAEPSLGRFVLAGLGGIWAELVHDVQVRPVGLREGAASDMIRSLRAFEVLEGARKGPRVSVERIVDAVERLDQVALALGADIDAIDINPLVVLPDRAIVVDALFVRAGGE